MNARKLKLSVDLGRNLKLRNPVMTASGTFGYGEEFAPYLNLERLGGFVTKGLSLNPRLGNPMPRLVETPSGMLNAIGLQNVGLEAFIAKKVPYLRTVNTPALVNFFGGTIADYAIIAEKLNDIPEVAGLEMNISCPNVKEGGIVFGTDPSCAASVVKACRAVTSKHLMVKLSPNVTDISAMAKTCEDEGADSLSLINTITGMAIDVKKRRPILANITGGLSGPAVKPIALRMVWQVAKAVKIPVIGMGGIMNAQDALEFILAGATAIQVGTASFVTPGIAETIVDDLEKWMIENGVVDIHELIGALDV